MAWLARNWFNILIIIGIVLFIVGIIVSLTKTKPDPFFTKRTFKYYLKGNLVAMEYRSFSEPSQLRHLGFEFPRYDHLEIINP